MTGAIESAEAARICLRRARFEDVNALLRLIEAAIEHGCRDHYLPAQRRAVFLTYAESLFLDVIRPIDTVLATRDEQMVGVAQLDPAAARLRALFVAPALQGRGLGRILLGAVERLARGHHLRTIDGAMSLNAVAFYRRHGFEARHGQEHLVRNGVVVPILHMAKPLPPEGIEGKRR
jgi:N-acetylglutamate synthase-like GNAT family acetyltransferase